MNVHILYIPIYHHFMELCQVSVSPKLLFLLKQMLEKKFSPECILDLVGASHRLDITKRREKCTSKMGCSRQELSSCFIPSRVAWKNVEVLFRNIQYSHSQGTDSMMQMQHCQQTQHFCQKFCHTRSSTRTPSWDYTWPSVYKCSTLSDPHRGKYLTYFLTYYLTSSLTF